MLFCAVLEFTVFTLSGMLLLISPKKISISTISRRTRNEMLLLVVLGTLGTFCLNFALANMSIILFAVIGLIEPILGLLISKMYHRESFTKFQKIGISLGVLSAFVLSLTK